MLTLYTPCHFHSLLYIFISKKDIFPHYQNTINIPNKINNNSLMT